MEGQDLRNHAQIKVGDWLKARIVSEAGVVWLRGVPIVWSPSTYGYSAGRRSLEFRLPRRSAGLHLPDYQNLKKLREAIRTGCGPTASMTEKSNLQLD